MLALLLLAFVAPTSAAATPYLAIHRAKHALAEPGASISECRHERRNAIICMSEYEGVFDIEPGEGDHQRVPVWAVLCRRHVYTLVAVGEVPNCRVAVETQGDHLSAGSPRSVA